MSTVAFSLGSNLGDRLSYLKAGFDFVSNAFSVINNSSIYETQAWGVTNQPDYLNMVILAKTNFTPDETINAVLNIEKEIGRVRFQKWEARVIDIDLLLFDNEIVNSISLNLPHPFLHERAFVLHPLNEIFPQWQHPILGKTISEIIGQSVVNSQSVLRTFATREFIHV